jgi:hypothetical protein
VPTRARAQVLSGAESGAALGAPAMLGLREILQGAAAQAPPPLPTVAPTNVPTVHSLC